MWYKLTLAQIPNFENRCCYRGMIWTGQNRFLGDGVNLLNVQTGLKDPVAGITEEDFNTDKYPLFSVKLGVLNKVSGFITRLNNYYLSDDGFYYCLALDDLVIPAVPEAEGVVPRPEITVPYSSWYDVTLCEGTTLVMPSFPDSPVII